MKRIFLSILIIVISLSGYGKHVDMLTAQRVGLAYYYEHAGQFVQLDIKSLESKLVYAEMNGDTPVFYVFEIAPKGYVIVSADDLATPVIGYSYESGFDPSKMPAELKFWLSEVKKDIVRAVNVETAGDSDISNQWDYYLSRNNENISIKKSKAVEPLLTSTWNQDKYYNMFCPAATGGPDDKAYAGCVATSMSQIMYYYRYPTTGNGSHGGVNFGATTYQWDNMLDDLTNYNEAVATLMWHCGVAVNMNYTATGSGASSTDVPSAMSGYFRYSSNCGYANKYTYSSSGWTTLLKTDLDAKHPMIYSGSDASNSGHAWVCDGYDASNNFHMNWGWSGLYNGYFALSNLTAGGSTFSYFQGVNNNIYPPTSSYPYSCSATKSVTGVTGTIEDGSGPSDYGNDKDCMWLIAPNEPATKITLSFINFSTETTNDVVTVYDGSTTSATVLGTFSGSTLPANVVSTGPQMLVRFTTNGSTTSSGWKATYKSTYPVFCSGIASLTAASGTVADGSEAENYTYNHTCRWRIEPAGATSITLHFTAFNLATNDYLKVYDATNNSLLQDYTGSSIPADQVYNTTKLLLFFKTDGYLNSEGFSVDYTSSGQGSDIEENTNLSQMTIFPNPANKEVSVRFSVDEPGNLKVELCTMTGTVVYTDEQNDFSGTYSKTINTSDLSQGVYLLRVTGDKQSTCKKVIIE